MKDITVLDRLTGGSSRVTIVVHTHPDGDAVGSGTAMLGYLTDIKRKNAALIVPDSVPDSISFITKGFEPGSVIVFEDERLKAEEWINSCDLIICLDCNSFSRTADMETLLRKSTARKVLIDHHLNEGL